MRRVCADTGFLIALYGERGTQHERASLWFRQLFGKAGGWLLVPWPILYESINTRLVSNRRQIVVMEQEFALLRKNHQLFYVDDRPYRELALSDVFSETSRLRNYRELSLADRVVRALLQDKAAGIDALLTNDEPAFQDVCRLRGLEMISLVRDVAGVKQ